jgi:hypothetical protein
MAQFADAWLEHQQRRFMRCDAQRWMRPDAHRWFRPDAERWLRPDRRKAYDPNQPRVPAGSPEGGQWTGDGSNEPQTAQEPRDDKLPVHLASDGRPPPPRASLAFAVRMALSLIRSYRRENTLNDMFDDEHGRVAFTRINGVSVFGTNSDVTEYSTAYTPADRAAAIELRTTMLSKYQNVMNLENIGHAPNDALFHAETTVLLRAWELNGRTLDGKELVVFVDGRVCRASCEVLLPFVGLELGNPMVVFIDRWGRVLRMKDGKWSR